MQIATLCIAILALVVSSLSLCWQIFSFTLAGRKVRILVSVGWRGAGTALILQSIKQRDDPLNQLSKLSGHGPSTPVLGVTVHNIGRSEFYISAVFVAGKAKSNTYFPSTTANWPKLPCLLKPGDSQNWYLDTAEFKQICDDWNMTNGDKRAKLELCVSLKDGRTIRARRRVKVDELQRIWNVSKASAGLPVAGTHP